MYILYILIAVFILWSVWGYFSSRVEQAEYSIVSSKSKYEIIDLENVNRKNFRSGRIKAEYGKASMQYLDTALDMLQAGQIDCLVTCPISKEAIGLAGYPYTGHTEYFARRTGSRDCVMMLMNDELKISLVTRHLPLRRVCAKITPELIIRTILPTARYLQDFFAIPKPRIVVCGLNPHASDNGRIGNEENTIIRPALAGLRKAHKLSCEGPLSADVAIAAAARKEFDAVIAMYHDQALIPLKLKGNTGGVNITLGLPFVRTSPLHGTAFDVAGSFEKADPSSLIAAINIAVQCASNLKKD